MEIAALVKLCKIIIILKVSISICYSDSETVYYDISDKSYEYYDEYDPEYVHPEHVVEWDPGKCIFICIIISHIYLSRNK